MNKSLFDLLRGLYIITISFYLVGFVSLVGKGTADIYTAWLGMGLIVGLVLIDHKKTT